MTENLVCSGVKVGKGGLAGTFQRRGDSRRHVVRLAPGLADTFQGPFTTICPAAVELDLTMSLLHDDFTFVTAAPDSESERHFVPQATELRDKVFLVDDGFECNVLLARSRSRGALHRSSTQLSTHRCHTSSKDAD